MRRTALAILGLALVTFPSVAFAGDDDDDTEDEEGSWIEPVKPVAPPEPVEEPDAEEPEPAATVPEPTAEPAPSSVEPAPAEEEEVRSAARFPLPAYYYTSRRKYLKPITGADPPDGYVVGERNKRGIWGGGIGVSAGSYLATLVLSAIVSSSTNDEDVLQFGAFPLVGPFILAAYSDEPGGGGTGLGAGALVLGLAQITGFCMILGGSIARGPTWKRVGELDAGPVRIGVGNGGNLKVSF